MCVPWRAAHKRFTVVANMFLVLLKYHALKHTVPNRSEDAPVDRPTFGARREDGARGPSAPFPAPCPTVLWSRTSTRRDSSCRTCRRPPSTPPAHKKNSKRDTHNRFNPIFHTPCYLSSPKSRRTREGSAHPIRAATRMRDM